jgi:hypothetical protein
MGENCRSLTDSPLKFILPPPVMWFDRLVNNAPFLHCTGTTRGEGLGDRDLQFLAEYFRFYEGTGAAFAPSRPS